MALARESAEVISRERRSCPEAIWIWFKWKFAIDRFCHFSLPLCVFPPASGSPRLRRAEPSCHELRGRLLPWGGNQHVESPMTMTTERRNFLKAVSAAAASTAVLAGTQALAQGNLQAAAKTTPYQAKPMPFDPKTITGISEKVLVSHYENNYVGAVKRLNAIDTQLAELDFAKAPNFVINGLKREELAASTSIILHEIYFDGLGCGSKAGVPLAYAV